MRELTNQTQVETPVIIISPRIWNEIFSESARALYVRGMYRDNLLYRSIPHEKISRVLETGSDRRSTSKDWRNSNECEYPPERVIYCEGEDLLKEGRYIDNSRKKGMFVVSVYTPENLTKLDDSSYNATYVLNEGARALAVLKIDLTKLMPIHEWPNGKILFSESRNFCRLLEGNE